MINKAVLNRIVNALATVLFCLMISTGMILKFILPPGSGRINRLMSGQHRGRSVDTLMGISRHEWGEIHFYISMAFLVVLAWHIVLHWNWIRQTAWGSAKCPQPLRRRAVTLLIILLILISTLLPWLFPVQTLSL